MGKTKLGTSVLTSPFCGEAALQNVILSKRRIVEGSASRLISKFHTLFKGATSRQSGDLQLHELTGSRTDRGVTFDRDGLGTSIIHRLGHGGDR